MKLSLPRVEELIKDYLDGGLSINALSKKYEVSAKSVKGYVAGLPTTRVEIEKEYFNDRIDFENKRITEIKAKYFNNIEVIMDSFTKLGPKDQIKAIDALNNAIEKLDKQFRLNNEMSTENISKQETVKKIDYAEILKELKTPEQKRAFLLNNNNE